MRESQGGNLAIRSPRSRLSSIPLQLKLIAGGSAIPHSQSALLLTPIRFLFTRAWSDR
jgi:hypothetical protein